MQTERPYRVSHRLRNADYSFPGAYYVTICTFKKRCLFGTVRFGKMVLNGLGEIVYEEWTKTPALRPGVRLGEFEVMPNHMHAIIIIMERDAGKQSIGGLPMIGGGKRLPGDLPVAPTGPRRGSVGAIIGNIKGAVTRRVRRQLDKPHFQVWQRNYYDHIIRDDDDWQHIRAYIVENPMNWAKDPLYPTPT
jgi:REP element-mobilizing transposase RayT